MGTAATQVAVLADMEAAMSEAAATELEVSSLVGVRCHRHHKRTVEVRATSAAMPEEEARQGGAVHVRVVIQDVAARQKAMSVRVAAAW